MLYTNVKSGKSFYSDRVPAGRFYTKTVSLFCHKYEGFGIDAQLFEDKVLNGNRDGIDFKVKEDLRDFRSGKIVCERGVYRIDLAGIERYGVRDTLNARFGEQLFVPIWACEKVGG